jgi:filamentous hemagglutinin
MEAMASAISNCQTKQCERDTYSSYLEKSVENLEFMVSNCPLGGATNAACSAEVLEQYNAIVTVNAGELDQYTWDNPYNQAAVEVLHQINLLEKDVAGQLAAGAAAEEVAKSFGLTPEETAVLVTVASGVVAVVANGRRPENIPSASVTTLSNKGTIPGAVDAEVGGSQFQDNISTAKFYQVNEPRDFNEQMLWNRVVSQPSSGKPLIGMNNDPRFRIEDGWQKMQADHKLSDGSTIVIHYQYNKNDGLAYDMKIDTPIRNSLQPGPSIVDIVNEN